ncbi:MAG: restriction endonuclease subunit S [Methylococcaceae bacterium]|nr:restriction endonuclease subunit S [Methylococcaceae bacterium]
MPIREAYSFTRKPRGMVIPRDGSIPFLPMDLIPIGRVSVSEYEERPGSRLTSGTYIENGDLVVAKITPSFENGKQAIVQWNRPFGFATTEVIPIQEIEGVSDKNYLFHVLLHPAIRSDLAGKMDGTTGRQRLSKEVLGSRLITLPPLAEQRKIAGVLGVVQRAMEQQERLIALTTELKKALLRQLFTQGLRGEPQKQTDIGPVPQDWEVMPLGELACKPDGFLQTGPFGSQLHKHDYLSEGVGVVNPTHLWDNQINHEEVPRVSPETAARLERHRLAVGDILFARRGEIGRHGMVTEKEEGWLCGTGCFLARVRRKDIDNRFLSYLFSTSGCIAWLNSHAAGAIMPNLNNTVLRSMPVFFPKLEIQTEIANCLDATKQKMAIHQRKHAALTALFRTLLHKLMTAQIRVDQLDIEEFNVGRS